MKNRLTTRIQLVALSLALMSPMLTPTIKAMDTVTLKEKEALLKALEAEATIEAADFFGIDLKKMTRKAVNVKKLKWCAFCDRMILLLEKNPNYKNTVELLRQLRCPKFNSMYSIRWLLKGKDFNNFPVPLAIREAFKKLFTEKTIQDELEAVIKPSL